ncbi:hypothetical protein CHCC14821_2234 [Bacillus paralicheniformis]|nr:hypothetical protein CHCC14821_2234 [Bacillus paralicheniformis]
MCCIEDGQADRLYESLTKISCTVGFEKRGISHPSIFPF